MDEVGLVNKRRLAVFSGDLVRTVDARLWEGEVGQSGGFLPSVTAPTCHPNLSTKEFARPHSFSTIPLQPPTLLTMMLS